MDLNVVKLTNFETEESSQEFLNKVNSKLLLDLSKSQIVENDEWIEMVEFSLPHLEKALTKEIKNIVTEEEIIILKQNKYVKKVTSKGITYTDEFKRIFIDENGVVQYAFVGAIKDKETLDLNINRAFNKETPKLLDYLK